MTSLEAALAEINVTLNRLHVSFALVGGLALLAFVRCGATVWLGRPRSAEARLNLLRVIYLLVQCKLARLS